MSLRDVIEEHFQMLLKDIVKSKFLKMKDVEAVESDHDLYLAIYSWGPMIKQSNIDVVHKDDLRDIAQSMLDRSGDDGYDTVLFNSKGQELKIEVKEVVLREV